MWRPLGSYLCKHAYDHSVTTEACSSPHITCLGLCGVAAWKLNGVICAMFWSLFFAPDKIDMKHYCDVMMGMIASEITSLTIVFSNVYSDADQRKHQSSSSLTFVRGIHRGTVNSPHKWPVTRKMFPFDDVIINVRILTHNNVSSWYAQNLRVVCISYIYQYNLLFSDNKNKTWLVVVTVVDVVLIKCLHGHLSIHRCHFTIISIVIEFLYLSSWIFYA